MTQISVTLIDYMGTDLSPVNAARVSYAKQKKVLDGNDVGLIGFLNRNDHWSPFAHAFMSFRIKAPIFVARQLVKHQVGLAWNEVSRRYVDDTPEFYMPDEWRARPQANIKQGSTISDELDQEYIKGVFHESTVESLEAYNTLLEQGIAPEMARMVLPLNTMTEWIWSGSLYAFARVCKLRLDSHAQAETSIVAEGISNYAKNLFPYCWAALVDVED